MERSQVDPRLYQIGALSLLLIFGIAFLHLDVTLLRVLITVASAVATQAICTHLWQLPRFDPRSALISALSLSLLLRSDSVLLLVTGGVLAIASKFVLRVRNKHVFNPTNFAVVLLLLVTDRVWVSPGQWGSVAFFGFLMACIGLLVVNRAGRTDVTFAFLLTYASLLVGRSIYLGEPLTIPVHRLESGALLLFAFFMISDPKTTPDSRAGRILFAMLVAAGATFVQFRLFRTNGLLWSLALCSAAVPLIDLVHRRDRYEWPGRQPMPLLMNPTPEGGPVATRPGAAFPAQPGVPA